MDRKRVDNANGASKIVKVTVSRATCNVPPSEKELLQMLKKLHSMPSCDKSTREIIDNLPPEVSDPANIEEMGADPVLLQEVKAKVDSAMDLLETYNAKLDSELNDRKQASKKLQQFVNFEKESLAESETLLAEHKQHIEVLTKLMKEARLHVDNMPEVPSSEDLSPLPSVKDLFKK